MSNIRVGAATSSTPGLLSADAQGIGGVKTFHDGIKLDDAAGQATLSDYRTGTATATFTMSGGYSQAVTVRYTVIGNICTMRIPNFSATATSSNVLVATGFTTTNSITPFTEQHFFASVTNNGSLNQGRILLLTNGNIQLRAGIGTSNFTDAATAGLAAETVVTFALA